jgi:hypothetical protein
MNEIDFQIRISRKRLEHFIKENEKPAWLDWFGLYPAKSAVNASKVQLKAMNDILTEPVKVKYNHEGHLFTFGESTIEVEYIGVDPTFPFDRVNKGDK